MLAAGILLGIGLGDFIDGILLHQLLQWHDMLSSTVPPIIGVAWLWRAGGKPNWAGRSSPPNQREQCSR